MKGFNVLVSVHMVTYQHVNFIHQAIDSILMQKTNFKYEIVIGDDFSTDGTREILKEYKRKYPDKIKLLLNKKNIGGLKNGINVKKNCVGKYIAFLEGDDYWTDENKLQSQVDFLENNEDYIACYTGVNVIGNDIKACKSYRTSNWDIKSIENYYKKVPVIPTATLVMKNLFLNKENLKYFMKTKYIGDRIIHALIIKEGKIKYIDYNTAVYRFITNNNVSFSSLDQIIKWKDYTTAIKMQRQILPKYYYKLVSKLITDVQIWIIDEYIKEKKYKECLEYIIKEVKLSEIKNIILQKLFYGEL